jgi:DNA-binding XRE family transcriptional regulator
MTVDRKFKSQLDAEAGPLSFALFLRVARTSLGLTQEQLGKKLGLSRANICDIEKGRHLVSTELALKVARKAGLSEKMALQACLQDQVRKAGSDAKVALS